MPSHVFFCTNVFVDVFDNAPKLINFSYETHQAFSYESLNFERPITKLLSSMFRRSSVRFIDFETLLTFRKLFVTIDIDK